MGKCLFTRMAVFWVWLMGYNSIGPPNKIQARVLPFMLKGSDIIAQAPPTQERIIS